MVEALEAQAIAFGFVLIRIAAILMTMPIWSGRMPATWKAGAIIWLSVIFSFVVPVEGIPESLSVKELLFGIGREFLVGAFMGFSGQLLMGAIMLAGTLAGFQMGLGIAGVVDPISGQNGSVVAQLLNLLALFLFLEINGHLLAVRLLVKSFELVPPFSPHLSTTFLGQAVRDWGGNVFQTGFQLAWPLSIALLLVYMSIALIGRMAPQMNLMMIGFPITIMVGFSVLYLSVPQMLFRFEQLFRDFFISMERLLLVVR